MNSEQLSPVNIPETILLNIMESDLGLAGLTTYGTPARYPASAMGRAIERLKAKKLLETNGYSVTKGKNHKKKKPFKKSVQN